MRSLTVKQKKLLNQIITERPETGQRGAEDLTFEEWEKIEAMNDTEILWTEVDRYLYDAYMKR